MIFTVFFNPSMSNFTVLVNRIQTAVVSGSMTTSIQSAAVANNFPALQTVSVSTPPQISNPLTFSPTSAPVVASQTSNTVLSIALGVGLGVALLLIILIIYTVYQYKKTRMDNETFKEWTESVLARKKSFAPEFELDSVVMPSSNKLESTKISHPEVHGQLVSPRIGGNNPMPSTGPMAVTVTNKGRTLKQENDSAVQFDLEHYMSPRVEYQNIHKTPNDDFGVVDLDLQNLDKARTGINEGGRTSLPQFRSHNGPEFGRESKDIKKAVEDMRIISEDLKEHRAKKLDKVHPSRVIRSSEPGAECGENGRVHNNI